MLQHYRYIAQLEHYGNATKYRINKNYLRALWIGIFIIIPLVTPLATLSNKVFKRDIMIIRRGN